VVADLITVITGLSITISQTQPFSSRATSAAQPRSIADGAYVDWYRCRR